MKEFLAISEETLEDIIAILRIGLEKVQVPRYLSEYLSMWCDEEYLHPCGSTEC